MAFRRTFRGRRSGPRRMTDWIFATGIPVGLVSVPDATQRVIGSVAIAEGGVKPGTIVRIRGTIHLELAAETAADTLQSYGVGVGLFDDRALAVSSSAGVGLPEPIGDADDEKWMWIHYGFLGLGPGYAATAESDGTGRRGTIDIEVDTKAMRKWDENQTLVWLVQSQVIDGAATEIDAVVMARMLLKLP